MLMPKTNKKNYFLGENLLDDFFGFPAFSDFGGFNHTVQDMMSTDIKESDAGYEISMNLPGFKKEDVKGELKDGYLTIQASSETSKDEKEDGKYIRKERYSGSCSRSFYVGEELTQEDIKASFKDGVLTLNVPKKEAKPAVEQNRYIQIEG